MRHLWSIGLLLLGLWSTPAMAQTRVDSDPNATLAWEYDRTDVQFKLYVGDVDTGVLTNPTCTGAAPNFICEVPNYASRVGGVLTVGDHTLTMSTVDQGREGPKSAPLFVRHWAVGIPNAPRIIRISNMIEVEINGTKVFVPMTGGSR